MKRFVLIGVMLFSIATGVYANIEDNNYHGRAETTYGYTTIPSDYDDDYGYRRQNNGDYQSQDNGTYSRQNNGRESYRDSSLYRERKKDRQDDYYDRGSIDNGTAGGGGEAGPQAID